MPQQQDQNLAFFETAKEYGMTNLSCDPDPDPKVLEALGRYSEGTLRHGLREIWGRASAAGQPLADWLSACASLTALDHGAGAKRRPPSGRESAWKAVDRARRPK